MLDNLTVAQFSAAVRAAKAGTGAAPASDTVVLSHAPIASIERATKADDRAQAGEIVVTISVGTPDRSKDVVNPGGVQLRSYARNPVVLWAHDHRTPAIARAPRTWLVTPALKSIPEFPTREMHPFGFMCGELLRSGFLNAASIGFRALEWTYDEQRGGVNFVEVDLVEWSVVNVPMHPDALVEARAAGVDLTPMRPWLEAQVALYLPEMALVPRAVQEAALRTLSGNPASVTVPDVERARKKATCPKCGKDDVPEGADTCPKCNAPMKPRKAAAEDVTVTTTVTSAGTVELDAMALAEAMAPAFAQALTLAVERMVPALTATSQPGVTRTDGHEPPAGQSAVDPPAPGSEKSAAPTEAVIREGLQLALKDLRAPRAPAA